jgi:hypothetical protein
MPPLNVVWLAISAAAFSPLLTFASTTPCVGSALL